MFRMNKLLKSSLTNKKRIPHFRLFHQGQIAEISRFKNALQSDINTLYHRLNEIINTKQKLAIHNKKKLLITAADKHDEKHCIVTHLTVVELLKKYGIKHLAVEMPDTILNLILTDNYEALSKYQNNSNSNFDATIKIAMQKGIAIHPIDLPFNQWCNRPLLQFSREEHMVNRLLLLNQDVGLMVGTLHLLPIYRHPQLKEKYEILCINSYKSTKQELAQLEMTDDENKRMQFANSDEVTNISLKPKHCTSVSQKNLVDWSEAKLKQLTFDLGVPQRRRGHLTPSESQKFFE